MANPNFIAILTASLFKTGSTPGNPLLAVDVGIDHLKHVHLRRVLELQAVAEPGRSPNPEGNLLAKSTTLDAYINDTPSSQMNSQSISQVGGSQPHNNFQPYLCVDFIISLYGIFPSQT